MLTYPSVLRVLARWWGAHCVPAPKPGRGGPTQAGWSTPLAKSTAEASAYAAGNIIFYFYAGMCAKGEGGIATETPSILAPGSTWDIYCGRLSDGCAGKRKVFFLAADNNMAHHAGVSSNSGMLRM